LVIEDASLQHGAISTAVLDAGDITPELIMNLVEGAIESNEDFIISEDTNITITTIDGTYHQEKQKKKKLKNTKVLLMKILMKMKRRKSLTQNIKNHKQLLIIVMKVKMSIFINSIPV
jgi:hypothetical protein